MEILHEEEKFHSLLKKYQIETYFTDIERFKKELRLISFPKGTYLYSRPEHKKYAYFLVSGRLQVYTADADGNQMLVRYCEDFIFIGDMELLGYPEPANMVETVTSCTFIGLDILRMKEMILEDPKFLRFLCDSLAEKLKFFASMQTSIKLNSPQERLASYILETAGEKCFFRENLRKTSEILGISYRHLHRILAEFVDNGVLRRKERGYEIADRKRLEAFIRVRG